MRHVCHCSARDFGRLGTWASSAGSACNQDALIIQHLWSGRDRAWRRPVPYKRDRRGREAIITPQSSPPTSHRPSPAKSPPMACACTQSCSCVTDAVAAPMGDDILTLLVQVVRQRCHKLRLRLGLLQLLRLCQRQGLCSLPRPRYRELI
jgi:hypothetical protein